MALLLHLNGAPGVGKSTIASMVVERRPLALALDIDALRVRLGQWRARPESKGVARTLGFDLAERHLRDGHDVVVPQLLVDRGQIDRLRAVAERAGADHRQLVLSAPVEEIVGRLRGAGAAGGPHPRDEFTVEQLERQIAHACAALAELSTTDPSTQVVNVGGLLPEAAAAVTHDLVWGRE